MPHPLEEVLTELVTSISGMIGIGTELLNDVHAIYAGNPTDEQLGRFTKVVHDQFDENNGCMVDAVRELAEIGAPHYAINHVIRTYVRVCDTREVEAANERNASHNDRYGKAAQQR